MKISKKEIFTIPNLMGYLRILLIPIFIILYRRQQYVWAIAALAVNVLTDFFDGMVARRFNQITELGKFIDPVADKLTQAAVVITLALDRPLLWPLLAIEVLKESFMMIAGALTLRKKGTKLDGAKLYGKICTALTDATLLALLVFPGMPSGCSAALIGICAADMLLTLGLYIGEFRRMWSRA